MPLIIRARHEHGGAAFIDVISPCVTFNNHGGSTKSYDYVRQHNEAVSRIDFITPTRRSPPAAPGAVIEVPTTTAPSCACASSPPTTTRPTAWPRWTRCSAGRARRAAHRPALHRPAGHRPAPR